MTSRSTLLIAGAALAGVAVTVRSLSSARAGGPTVGSARLSDADDLLRDPDLPARVRTVTTDDGADLHVREYGDPDATPIVLSHGWTCSGDFWAPQINDLAGRYRVVVYDQRGHGSSGVGTRPLGADVLGDDLAAVLDATVTPDHTAVLAGHSMGGMSVMSWAATYPDQVRRYVRAILLANTAGDSLVRETTVIPLPPGAPRLSPAVASRVLGSALPIPSTPFSARALRYVTMGAGSTAAQVEFCSRIVRECSPRTRASWGTALSALDIRDAVVNIDVPTSVIVGTNDRLTPPVHARKLAERLTRAGVLGRLIELPGVGHMSSVEAIEEFDAELVRLAELPA